MSETRLDTVKEDKSVVPGFGSLQSFELAQRAAKLLCQSSLVPKEYQGNLPNCVIALNMATRMNADPLMVMQNLYIVHGRPGWSSQFLISTFNTSGRFSALRYDWLGKEGTDGYGCRAWAIEKVTGEKLTGSTVTIRLAKKEGWYSKKDRNGNEISKWQTMPQQMLMYRAASWFIRAYAPELAMGMHTADEIQDAIDLSEVDYEWKVEEEVKQNANSETIDVEIAAPEQEPEPAPAPKKEKKAKADTPTSGPAKSAEGPGF